MTAPAAAIRCACCGAERPAGGVYEPVARTGEYRCRDQAGCRRRMAYLGDPVGVPDVAAPPAVPGAGPCALCGAAGAPGGVYERTPGIYVCLDRAGCGERAVGYQYLTAQRDSFGPPAYTSAQMRRDTLAVPPQVPAPEPDEAAERLQAAAQADRAYGHAAASRAGR